MAHDETYAILGANMAGASAAETLRQEGCDGRIVLVGAEPDLPYERPPLSKGWLLGKTTQEKITPHQATYYADQGIELRLGVRATALDASRRVVTLEGGEELAYDRLLLATGTIPRTLDLPGADLAGIHLLRTLADARRLAADLQPGRRLVVIGAGFIGAEVASAARQLGLAVTMLEILPVPLRRALGDDIGRRYAGLHRAHGVDLRLHTGVARFSGADRVAGVVTSAGDEIACDAVVVGVGVRPATDWLVGSGVGIENGVLVDEYGATNVPSIAAAGDVANWWHPGYQARLRVEHFDHALKHGAAVARNLLGKREAYAPVPYFWSEQYDVYLQYLGHATFWDEVVLRGDVDGYAGSVWYLQSGIPRAALLFNRQREQIAARKILAAGKPLAPAQLADTSIDLRTLVGS